MHPHVSWLPSAVNISENRVTYEGFVIVGDDPLELVYQPATESCSGGEIQQTSSAEHRNDMSSIVLRQVFVTI